jgi:hypothetical protein
MQSNGILAPAFAALTLSNSASVTGVLPIANGGSNNGSLAVTAGGVIYTDGSKLVNVGAGTSGYLLQSNGASAPTWVTPPASSPLTTKGDTYVYSTTNARQAVPGDYGHLIADSSQATGWRSGTYTQTNGKPGKNYIQYADFENNATTGWSLGTIGTLTNSIPTGTPTFGSGASGNLSIATTSSSPLSGANSLSYVSSAATTQGNMLATAALNIDQEDQAKVLTFRFYYKLFSFSSTQPDFSGTSTNSFAVAAYDVTNSSWLSLAGNFAMTQSSGVGIATGTFQTNATTSSIRFVIYNANATAGAVTMYFDDFYVGPQTAPIGAVVTDFSTRLTFTPSTGFGTVTNSNIQSKRVGDTLRVYGSWSAGTTTAVTASITLPSGLTLDTSKLNPFAGAYQKVGSWTQMTNSSTFIPQSTLLGDVVFDGTTTNSLYFVANVSGNLFTKSNVNAIWSNSASISFYFEVPITGWSSQVQLSSDTDTRVIAMRANGSSSSTITTSFTAIPFNTVVSDTAGAYNTNGTYTIPVTGYYDIAAQAYINGTPTIGAAFIIDLYNATSASEIAAGTQYNYQSASVNAGSSTINLKSVQLNAGTQIQIRALYAGTITSPTLGTGTTTTYFSVSRVSGPAVIAATESVNASYYSSGTTSISTTQMNNYDVKLYDSHNAVTTGAAWKFTAPVSGKYSLKGFAGTTGSLVYIMLYKNGSAYAVLSYPNSAGLANFAYDIQLNAGDYIDIRGNTTGMGLTGGSQSGTSVSNIQIARIGN